MMRYPNRIGGPVRLAHADDRAADGEMTKAESSTGRIPYLDGLRAFSVLFVVLAHAFGPAGDHWPTVARLTLLNSSLGVHVFFVLSGFLITSMLLDERER
ncbi:MAG TPA: acyltransferase family protein, partial [Fimbriimonadaceae bacterium]|nr:acyltransferase family protein [Fimbriimonadaceae bacterium]